MIKKIQWELDTRKKFEYDIYYFNGGSIFHILKNPKSYQLEILECDEYSTFIAIALVD